MLVRKYRTLDFGCNKAHVFDRFVEYWARSGSEDNMTSCHRPTCRKEGVLLDYSTDGGE